MMSIGLNQTKQWLKKNQSPLAKTLYAQIKAIRHWGIPAPRLIFTPLYVVNYSLRSLISTLMRIFWWTPLLKGRLNYVGRNFYLYGGLPYISGALDINIGDNCRVSGRTTFSGRTCTPHTPELKLGNNIDIGYMTTIAVGRRVVIKNNVRIAGQCLLAGYPGHPLDANKRSIGLPETDDQVGDIILEDDVWLATGVSVLAGVTIGHGTIIATGSVVTHDLPPMVLAGGIPAKIIRYLERSKKDSPECNKGET